MKLWHLGSGLAIKTHPKNLHKKPNFREKYKLFYNLPQKTQGERGQFVKVILIQSPDAPKCIPGSEKTTNWDGFKKNGFSPNMLRFKFAKADRYVLFFVCDIVLHFGVKKLGINFDCLYRCVRPVWEWKGAGDEAFVRGSSQLSRCPQVKPTVQHVGTVPYMTAHEMGIIDIRTFDFIQKVGDKKCVFCTDSITINVPLFKKLRDIIFFCGTKTL
jgi:hypothetical protein